MSTADRWVFPAQTGAEPTKFVGDLSAARSLMPRHSRGLARWLRRGVRAGSSQAGGMNQGTPSRMVMRQPHRGAPAGWV